MSLTYPSREYDAAVAAVCHGTAAEEVMQGLNTLLREHAAARDEYLLRVELHSRLASAPNLFTVCGIPGAGPSPGANAIAPAPNVIFLPQTRSDWPRRMAWVAGMAACTALAVVGWQWLTGTPSAPARKAGAPLNQVEDGGSSAVVHLDFENGGPHDQQQHHVRGGSAALRDPAIIGCRWIEGRLPDTQTLVFRSVNDRVRVVVPGQFDALTLAAWVRAEALDRQFNSLFMCDGFDPGEVHWLIRNDGVLSLTVKGVGPGNFQIMPSPPVFTLDRLDQWVHLAVVVDGNDGHVTHYVDGEAVSEHALRFAPPFRIDAAELGNWNSSGFPDDDPALIRDFSGALDEFFLFGRALSDPEIRNLYTKGEPE